MCRGAVRQGSRMGVVLGFHLAVALVSASGGCRRRGSEGERGGLNLGGVRLIRDGLDAVLGERLGDRLRLCSVRGLCDVINDGCGHSRGDQRVLVGCLRRGAEGRDFGGRGGRRYVGELLGLVGCGGNSAASDAAASVSGTVNCSGATSFQTLVESAAHKFEDKYPDVTIAITGGGSGQGLSDVKDGKAQIGRSDVFAEEKIDAADAAKLEDHTVCVVGMGPVVNSNVDVDDLTTEQLKGIFTGAITDWSEVGGTAGKIQVIERKAGSGTRATFEAAVLAGDKAPESFAPVAEEDSSGTVVEKIQQTEGAISYLAFSYYDDTKFRALKVDGVEPCAENVCSGEFNIWAYEHMYSAKDADEATKAFLDFMMSDEVQGSLVEEEGFIPVSDMKVAKDAKGNVSSK